MTPLQLAVTPYGNGTKKVLTALLEEGADINIRNSHDKTLLHLAVNYYHTEAVKLLVKQGANVNAQDENGNTPLHEAAQNGYIATIELLIKQGADIHAQNNDGKSPYDIIKDKHLKILKKLQALQLKIQKGKTSTSNKTDIQDQKNPGPVSLTLFPSSAKKQPSSIDKPPTPRVKKPKRCAVM